MWKINVYTKTNIYIHIYVYMISISGQRRTFLGEVTAWTMAQSHKNKLVWVVGRNPISWKEEKMSDKR
jgi:hypothetical protein